MTLIELLRRAKQIDPNLTIKAFDRFDYEVRPHEVTEERETMIEVWKANGDPSHEGIQVTMYGDQVATIKPGTTVRWWQADPILQAFRASKLERKSDDE